MKKSCFYFILALVIALSACNEPIFHTISVEPPKAEPRIDGSPTNFVVIGNAMFVASGKFIWKYESGSWTSYRQDKLIRQLATANIVIPTITPAIPILFALCVDGSVKFFTSSVIEAFEITDDITNSIFAANDTLFLSDEDDSIFYILSDFDGGDILYGGSTPLKAELRGVAYDGSNYYLCTKSGIYYVNTLASTQSTVSLITGSAIDFVGIIKLDNTVVAITRDGKLYQVETSGVTEVASFGSRFSTGALAIWTDGTNKLLLAGRQDKLEYAIDSGSTYGYMELELDSTATNGIKDGSDFVEPGTADLSTVADYDRYVSTLRKNPVNHIFQAPSSVDTKMTLFASTQLKGVWSYRDHGDGKTIWNAEE